MADNGPAELKKMIGEMQELSRGRFLKHVTRPIGHEMVVRIKTCFTTSSSPYKEPWAPVSRGGMPLLDKDRLARAFQDASKPGTVEINNPTVYGPIQNFGGWVVAKNKPFLRFQVRQQGAALATRGGQVVRRRRATKQWVQVKMVYIEARQFLPDDRGLPPEWEAAVMLIVRSTFIKRYPSLQLHST